MIDPMQLPDGLDEELDLLDTLAQDEQRRKAGLPPQDDDDDDEDDEDGGGGRKKPLGRPMPEQEQKRQWGAGLMRKYTQDEFKRTFPSRGS